MYIHIYTHIYKYVYTYNHTNPQDNCLMQSRRCLTPIRRLRAQTHGMGCLAVTFSTNIL